MGTRQKASAMSTTRFLRPCTICQWWFLLPAAISAAVTDQPNLPNDPLLPEQWYLFAPDDERGGAGSVNALEAWEHTLPANPITVAVLDSGVNYKHPDLEANVWKNEGESENGKDDDANGYIDDMHGWDFVNDDHDPVGFPSREFPDQFGHGTAVAGLMAAAADNGIGIAGIGRNVKIMPLRIVGEPAPGSKFHAGPRTTLPQAIRYAIRNGARVIVCTLLPVGAAKGSVEAASLEASLREADKAGILLVWSAGNQGRNVDTDEFVRFPRFSNILIVGGTIRDGGLSPHMNFGKRVGIAAPCVDMVFPSFDGYSRSKGPGTSFAAALVAGAAATLLSQQRHLTPADVITRMQETSDLAPDMAKAIRGGRLNMARLLSP